ncbi:MAG TPA: hypothetical protein VGI73_04835 [Solirubrobacterales bacterium]|jgi:hypothetical protein
MAAAALLAARAGVRRVPIVLAIALAVSGAGAMLTFWAYYWSHDVGLAASLVLPLGSALLIGLSLWDWRPDRELARQLAIPFALWILATAFLVYLGFMHGGSGNAIESARSRFSGGLPTDNVIPAYFADWFYAHGHHGAAPVFPGEWLASDRPPLQTGYALQQRPWFWDQTGIDYTLIGVALQQLWVIGLWALLIAARARRVTIGLAMIAVAFSDLAIVNGFYVWPKLLPAAMLLAVAAIVLTPLWSQSRHDWRIAVLLGALAALAMLGHGSSVFGIIPLALVALFRGLPDWRWLGAAVAATIVLMAPWSAYQRWGDPPGNRLDRWFLAGRLEVSDESTGHAVISAYEEAGLSGALHNKGQNFVAIAGGGPAVDQAQAAIDSLEAGNVEGAVTWTRSLLFYFLLPSLGLLLVTPVAMLLGRRRIRDRDEWRLALLAYVVLLIGAVAWGLILFGSAPARTVIHQGSYLLPILGLAAGAVGLRAVFPRFANWFVPIAALATLALYVPSFTPEPGTSYSAAAIVLAALFAALFWAVALGLNPALFRTAVRSTRGTRRSGSVPTTPRSPGTS